MADQQVEFYDFEQPHEVRDGDRFRADIVNLANGPVARMTLQPGWRWSIDVKPVAGTDWCEAPHQQVLLSGRMHVQMADGREMDLGPGSVSSLPEGHDAWVIGDEPVVAVDWFGASNWARPHA
jgi:hypothetical protein